MEPKFVLIYTGMIAVRRSIAYIYAGLEDEVEICIMSFYSAFVKRAIPWGRRIPAGCPGGM
jgi:hypothetical protein